MLDLFADQEIESKNKVSIHSSVKDGSVGMQDLQGRYLENQQLEPDIEVYNSPESQLKGEDHQLEEAVKEMLKEVSKK